MGDYPEHLNPFKRSGGIRGSFRSIKSAIGGRFRKKKDDDLARHTPGAANGGATLRHHHSNGTTNGTNGTLRSQAAVSELFPRSRFNERVARAQTMAPTTDHNLNDNPFNETQANGIDHNSDGTETMRRRRRKKRAPLPPGGRNMLNVPGDHHNSQWSISSYETDCSSATYYTHSENELDASPDNPERLRDIQEISKEIQMLCVDDSSTKVALDATDGAIVITNGDSQNGSEQATATPTLIVTTDNTNPDDGNISKIDNDNTNETEHDTSKAASESDTANSTIVINEDDVAKTPQDDVVHDTNDSNVIEKDAIVDCELNNNTINKRNDEDKDVDTNESILTKQEANNEEIVCDNNEIVDKNETKDTPTTTTPVAEVDATCMVVDEQNNNGIDSVKVDTADKHDDQIVTDTGVEYVQRKSIYIAGSVDNLDAVSGNDIQFNESSTLFISGSRDQLDSLPPSADTDRDEKTDELDEDGQRPTPKIRKHKLGRDILLGSSDMLNVSQ